MFAYNKTVRTKISVALSVLRKWINKFPYLVTRKQIFNYKYIQNNNKAYVFGHVAIIIEAKKKKTKYTT